ncbi:MAG: YraN family protein [Bacteroidales bacterium]|jgi:putative endonuclease|nr:YraN family protein [Bacteroidales bacterium]
MNMEREKRDRQSTGREGEELAKNYLIERGFRILHTNWRTGHKELDIVAVKAEKIHFVEVRTHSRASIVSPEQTIDRTKQRTVIKAARAYMAIYRITAEAQFDVIGIVFGKDGKGVPDYKLEYIPNAFTLLV